MTHLLPLLIALLGYPMIVGAVLFCSVWIYGTLTNKEPAHEPQKDNAADNIEWLKNYGIRQMMICEDEDNLCKCLGLIHDIQKFYPDDINAFNACMEMREVYNQQAARIYGVELMSA